jgi:hypothetical protein
MPTNTQHRRKALSASPGVGTAGGRFRQQRKTTMRAAARRC